MLKQPGEEAFAVDVFADQHLNLDESGRGDLGRFTRNVKEWTGDAEMTVIQGSSLDLWPQQLPSPCRLVSIDGGHTEECAASDLPLVEAVLHTRGVIILDDSFNQSWPGVAAGAARHFVDPTTKT